jgi:hypothetical protein
MSPRDSAARYCRRSVGSDTVRVRMVGIKGCLCASLTPLTEWHCGPLPANEAKQYILTSLALPPLLPALSLSRR